MVDAVPEVKFELYSFKSTIKCKEMLEQDCWFENKVRSTWIWRKWVPKTKYNWVKLLQPKHFWGFVWNFHQSLNIMRYFIWKLNISIICTWMLNLQTFWSKPLTRRCIFPEKLNIEVHKIEKLTTFSSISSENKIRYMFKMRIYPRKVFTIPNWRNCWI